MMTQVLRVEMARSSCMDVVAQHLEMIFCLRSLRDTQSIAISPATSTTWILSQPVSPVDDFYLLLIDSSYASVISSCCPWTRFLARGKY